MMHPSYKFLYKDCIMFLRFAMLTDVAALQYSIEE